MTVRLLMLIALMFAGGPVAAKDLEKDDEVKAAPEANALIRRAEEDGAWHIETDDPDMQAAYARARASLDGFLAVWRNPPAGAEDFSVKVVIVDDNGRESFWIALDSVDGDTFAGTINNTPRLVRSVRNGQRYEFTRARVVDWTYEQDGRMFGNRTACVLLSRESPEERAGFLANYGLDCD